MLGVKSNANGTPVGLTGKSPRTRHSAIFSPGGFKLGSPSARGLQVLAQVVKYTFVKNGRDYRLYNAEPVGLEP
ncbi:hypothetical protein SY88_09805 [Clostridiales bacterium PH28_bin88]|nr:hypothetical protein SY88_09805 [Clostridiales bacterium PH28_bin88]